MSVPRQSARASRGLLLVSGEPARVAAWVRRGLVPCHVVPLGRWTAVVPAEPVSRTEPPYDDGAMVLASRPVPHRFRPALGFWAVDGRAVATVTPRAWRVTARWLVWEPGQGAVPAPGLRLARALDLAAAVGRPGAGHDVARLVSRPAGGVDDLLLDLMELLDVPGGQLLGGPPEGGAVVEPAARLVARFNARVADDARHRAELEGL